MYPKTCNRCHGDKLASDRVKSAQHNESCYMTVSIVCPMCNGKGHITQQDIDEYYASWQFA